MHQHDSTFSRSPAALAPAQKKGCYITTAVYGSYDCPEVWTLRRFRDACLERNAAGRWLVRVYYRVCPWLVEPLGHINGIRRLCRSGLDRFVNCLNRRVNKDTPYQD